MKLLSDLAGSCITVSCSRNGGDWRTDLQISVVNPIMRNGAETYVRMSREQTKSLIRELEMALPVIPEERPPARIPGQEGVFIEQSWETLDRLLAEIRLQGLPAPNIVRPVEWKVWRPADPSPTDIIEKGGTLKFKDGEVVEVNGKPYSASRVEQAVETLGDPENEPTIRKLVELMIESEDRPSVRDRLRKLFENPEPPVEHPHPEHLG